MYSDQQVKEILTEIIFSIYHQHPVILSDLWDSTGEKKYIDHMHVQYEKILRDFNALFPDNNRSSKRILEISSFLAVVDIALAKIGFDVYTYDIPVFQENPNLNRLYTEFKIHPSSGDLKEISKTGLPYPDDHFDAVILSEVLEHLNGNPLPVLQEINRILKNDGVVYITTPNQVSLINRIKVVSGRSIRNPVSDFLAPLAGKNTICGTHWREYTVNELKELLEITGFSLGSWSVLRERKESASSKEKVFFRIADSVCILFPRLGDSIIIIGKKRDTSRIKFWFKDEYIKYYPTTPGK
jgi:SAM-dependent methyltransferase